MLRLQWHTKKHLNNKYIVTFSFGYYMYRICVGYVALRHYLFKEVKIEMLSEYYIPMVPEASEPP